MTLVNIIDFKIFKILFIFNNSLLLLNYFYCTFHTCKKIFMSFNLLFFSLK